jgi:hypothetical protein
MHGLAHIWRFARGDGFGTPPHLCCRFTAPAVGRQENVRQLDNPDALGWSDLDVLRVEAAKRGYRTYPLRVKAEDGEAPIPTRRRWARRVIARLP